MPSTSRVEAVDALALKFAFERLSARSMGNGVNEVEITEDLFSFAVERYAMVGYETFVGVLAIFHGPDVGILNGTTPHSKAVVFPSAMDVGEIVPAQEEHEYTVDEAIEFITDQADWSESAQHVLEDRDEYTTEQIIQEAHDLGMSEGDYYPPDEDFAWQELEYCLNQALADLPEGVFEPKEGRWSIVFNDGEVAHQYEPVRVKGVNYVCESPESQNLN